MRNIKDEPGRADGTSFHDVTLHATVNELLDVLGTPVCTPETYSYGDKVRWEWIMETKDGHVFTVYDWKEYREFGDSEFINWHIGASNRMDCINARREILEAYDKVNEG